VFGKGMLDTLDDVFWMLPFSSKKQGQIIRQENQITDLEWEKRRDLIMAEHRLPNSKEKLEQHWKAWIAQDAFTSQLRLSIQHVPIDTLDGLAKRCSSWLRGTKFESGFSEMQNKFR
jgi:hypothetical protein